jgi:hypothetical protein
MRARGSGTARREILGAAALLLALAVWCPRTEGQGGPKQSAADDLVVLRSVFPPNQPVTIRLRSVPPGQPETITGVRIVGVVEVFGTRFVRLNGARGGKILLRSAQIYSIESSGSAGAPKVGKGSFALSGPADLVRIKQGQKIEFKVTVTRKNGFKDAVRISVEAPPAVKIEPAETALPAEKSETVFVLSAPADAREGGYEFTLRAAGGDAKAQLRVKLEVEKK